MSYKSGYSTYETKNAWGVAVMYKVAGRPRLLKGKQNGTHSGVIAHERDEVTVIYQGSATYGPRFATEHAIRDRFKLSLSLSTWRAKEPKKTLHTNFDSGRNKRFYVSQKSILCYVGGEKCLGPYPKTTGPYGMGRHS